jgi:hypothetical protein
MSEYRAPVCEEDSEHVETPVGLPCVECDEPIAEGEDGVMVGVVHLGPRKSHHTFLGAIHKECMLLASVGPLAHLDKKCCCYGGDGHDSGMTMRQESLAVYRRIHACLS